MPCTRHCYTQHCAEMIKRVLYLHTNKCVHINRQERKQTWKRPKGSAKIFWNEILFSTITRTPIIRVWANPLKSIAHPTGLRLVYIVHNVKYLCLFPLMHSFCTLLKSFGFRTLLEKTPWTRIISKASICVCVWGRNRTCCTLSFVKQNKCGLWNQHYQKHVCSWNK